MTYEEAKAIYDLGQESVIAKLMELDQRVRKLEEAVEKLSKNSTNSSKPPSSDGPEVKKPPKKKSGRKPGGQRGRKGCQRELVPVEQADDQKDHYPCQCEKCRGLLDPSVHRETSKPVRYQTFELPEIKPIIIVEHRCHELECSCGHKTRASLPEAVS